MSIKMATVTKLLCLSRCDRLYIELPEAMSPNVLNGVTLLYKKYCKKTPGVIYNEPIGREQETVVALFLQAVHKTPEHKHVLILCNSSKLDIWTECLMKCLPDFDEVVAIDSPKLISKKSVYVTTLDRFASASYGWREWGITVVDDDFLLKFKLPSLYSLKAHYKIFISVDDMHEHLQKFATIHDWLFPDMKVKVDQFKPNKNSIVDILEKRIWFAAFVEDFLIKTNIKLTPPKETEVPEPVPRITRKNKDATGTKIKRTKRKAEDNNTDSAANKKITTNITETNNSNECASKLDPSNSTNNEAISTRAEYNNAEDTSKFEASNQNDDNMDIESFIRDREPLKMDELKYIPDRLIDNIPILSEKMDISEINSGLDEENSNDMKLNYSEELDPDDAVYSLETQDNGVENDGLESKDNDVESIINCNIATANVEEKTESKDFVECSNADTKNLEANVTKESIIGNLNDDADFAGGEKSKLDNVTIDNGLKSENSNSKDICDDKNKFEPKDEGTPCVKKKGIKKVGTKSDDLDTKWEEMSLKKFKGSLLDRIF